MTLGSEMFVSAPLGVSSVTFTYESKSMFGWEQDLAPVSYRKCPHFVVDLEFARFRRIWVFVRCLEQRFLGSARYRRDSKATGGFIFPS